MSVFSHDIFGCPISLEDLNVAFRCHDLDRVRPFLDPLRGFIPIEEVCGDEDIERAIIDRIDGDIEEEDINIPFLDDDDFVIEDSEPTVRVCGIPLADYLDYLDDFDTTGVEVTGMSKTQKVELVADIENHVLNELTRQDITRRLILTGKDVKCVHRPDHGHRNGFKPIDDRQRGLRGYIEF